MLRELRSCCLPFAFLAGSLPEFLDELTSALAHRKSDYLELVSPTYLENWPSSLSDLSIRQAGIALTPSEVNTLGVLNGIYTHRFKQQDAYAEETLRAKLATLLEPFQQGAFVRLGSRSTKDTHQGLQAVVQRFQPACLRPCRRSQDSLGPHLHRCRRALATPAHDRDARLSE